MLEQKPGVNSEEETVPVLGVLQSISPQARPPTSSSCSLRESHPESPSPLTSSDELIYRGSRSWGAGGRWQKPGAAHAGRVWPVVLSEMSSCLLEALLVSLQPARGQE